MSNPIKIGDEEFEEVPPKAVAVSRILADSHERLGYPEDPLTQSGEQMMRFIIASWEDLYPTQVKEWVATRNEYRNAEMGTMEQVVSQTGRSLASIPIPIYRMMKKIFPKYKLDNREDFMKFVKKFPMFRMANKL